jgi:hypothetical protein
VRRRRCSSVAGASGKPAPCVLYQRPHGSTALFRDFAARSGICVQVSSSMPSLSLAVDADPLTGAPDREGRRLPATVRDGRPAARATGRRTALPGPARQKAFPSAWIAPQRACAGRWGRGSRPTPMGTGAHSALMKVADGVSCWCQSFRSLTFPNGTVRQHIAAGHRYLAREAVVKQRPELFVPYEPAAPTRTAA